MSVSPRSPSAIGWKQPFLLFLAVTFFVVTYRSPGTVLSPGLDPSRRFALDYFFVHGLVPGRDFVFTFGPLGFLAKPVAPSTSLPIATAFWAATSEEERHTDWKFEIQILVQLKPMTKSRLSDVPPKLKSEAE